MHRKIYTQAALGALFICLNAVAVFAAEPDIKNEVSRAVAVQLSKSPYEVEILLHWEKEVTLGDMMLRAPRRPAHKEQVVRTEQKETFCRGVLVNQRQEVLMPTSCLGEQKYNLDSLMLRFQNGRSISKPGNEISTRGEIVWVSVPANVTAGLSAVHATAIPEGKSLQDAYGPDMTACLRSFFHARKVGPLSRTRPGLMVGGGQLQVGDALIYQGQVVALVKKSVSSYADGLGGVSESAFAVIR